jgi:hypothetical protein
MLVVVMLNVVMLNVVMPNVVAPKRETEISKKFLEGYNVKIYIKRK